VLVGAGVERIVGAQHVVGVIADEERARVTGGIGEDHAPRAPRSALRHSAAVPA
jgi:hypothetical protein